MRTLLVLTALSAVACGSSPVAPAKVYRADLSVSQPIVGGCADVRCQYSAVVTNAGPDCATRVSVAVVLSEGPGFVLAVGETAGTMRPGQVVTVRGNDWPSNGFNPRVTVAGDPIACP